MVWLAVVRRLAHGGPNSEDNGDPFSQEPEAMQTWPSTLG